MEFLGEGPQFSVEQEFHELVIPCILRAIGQ